jgi:hypothetical protein
LALAAVGAFAFVLFYALALPAHREAGQVFRALVDLAMPKLRESIGTLSPSIDTNLTRHTNELAAYLGAGRIPT